MSDLENRLRHGLGDLAAGVESSIGMEEAVARKVRRRRRRPAMTGCGIAAVAVLYVIGGTRFLNGDYAGEFDRVVRFTPATGQVTLLDAQVAPPGAAVKAIAFDGRRILVISAPREIYFYTPVPDAQVVAFNPTTGAVSPLPGSFPAVIGHPGDMGG